MVVPEVSEMHGLMSFLKSIDWTDPWFSLLLLFHVITTLTTFVSRRHGNIQCCLFLTLLLMVYFSERLNELGARHWRSFSRQQYFDSRGMFISVVFSFPLLFNCLLMVCYWLWTSGNLLVKLKRAQLRSSENKQK